METLTRLPARAIYSGKGDPAENMAFDECLLRRAQKDGRPQIIVRFYGWTRECVTMGYFQREEDVRKEFGPGIPIVRRITGGGAVRHGQDWTYSVVCPADLFEGGPRKSYRVFHQILGEAMAKAGLQEKTHLQPKRDGLIKPQLCFRDPSADDLMRGPQKIAGAAQRRSRGWLLHQGSVMLSGGIRASQRRALCEAFLTGLQSAF